MHPKVILFADNNQAFMNARTEYLSDKYMVLKASTPNEANQLMLTRRIHVAIIDIRLEDDGDENDVSGLELAKSDLFRDTPTIILSSYGTLDKIVDVMASALDGLPSAVDFVDKKAEMIKMREAVEQAFSLHVRLNQDLIIHFGQNLSFAHLATLITKPNDAFLMERAGEIEDLLRKHFADYEQTNVSRVLTHGDRSVFLDVIAFNKNGVERQYLISLGQIDCIQSEQERHKEYAPIEGGAGDTLLVTNTIYQTLHLGLISYMLAGNEHKRVEPFRNVYQRQVIDEIVEIIDNLCDLTLSRWQKTGKFDISTEQLIREYCNVLSTDYEQLPHASQKWIQAIANETQRTGLGRIIWSPTELEFELSTGNSYAWLNPVWTLSAEMVQGEHTIHSGITHGNLTLDTVMINPDRQTWLIDFSQTGKGPLALDFISLEISLRCQTAGLFDLSTRVQIEEQLLSEMIDGIDCSNCENLPAEANKELETIRYIRQKAMDVVHNNTISYLVGVYCYTLRLLHKFEVERRYSAQDLTPIIHIFIVLTMTLDRLANIAPTRRESLSLDVDSQSVKIGEKAIELTPQEFEILAYLHEHSGELRTKKQILADAMDTTAMNEEINNSRFNSAISRLRQKIEKDNVTPIISSM